MKKILFVISFVFFTGCATGPVLYPNAHLQKVGEAQAQKDIAECEVLADQYVKSDTGIAPVDAYPKEICHTNSFPLNF